MRDLTAEKLPCTVMVAATATAGADASRQGESRRIPPGDAAPGGFLTRPAELDEAGRVGGKGA